MKKGIKSACPCALTFFYAAWGATATCGYAFNEIVPDVRQSASISGGSACPGALAHSRRGGSPGCSVEHRTGHQSTDDHYAGSDSERTTGGDRTGNHAILRRVVGRNGKHIAIGPSRRYAHNGTKCLRPGLSQLDLL